MTLASNQLELCISSLRQDTLVCKLCMFSQSIIVTIQSDTWGMNIKKIKEYISFIININVSSTQTQMFSSLKMSYC